MLMIESPLGLIRPSISTCVKRDENCEVLDPNAVAGLQRRTLPVGCGSNDKVEFRVLRIVIDGVPIRKTYFFGKIGEACPLFYFVSLHKCSSVESISKLISLPIRTIV